MTTALRSSLHGLGLDDATMQQAAPKQQDRLIVGIDFGTTHSAIAWAHTSTPEEYEVITQWPGQAGKDWGKVPSDIAYYNTNAHNSSSSTPPTRSPTPAHESPKAEAANDNGGGLGFKWGFEVSPTDPNKLSWVKILLDPAQPRPTFVQPKKTTLPKGKKPLDIVTDYLTALRSYTLLTLSRRLGEDVVANTPIEYVLTVPAQWSDKGRQMTMDAAVRAGLGFSHASTAEGPGVGEGKKEGKEGEGEDSGSSRIGLLRLITEPEAAAEYALRSTRPNAMKVGDCFTVCDAGGGTVDLISLKITSLAPLQLDEVAVGAGALCGAVYLDRRFEDFVRDTLGKEVFDGMSNRARFQMMQYWETYMKREFSDSGDEEEADEDPLSDDEATLNGDGEENDGVGEFWVPVPGVPDSANVSVRGGFLRVSRKQVKSIFEPIVTQVLDLLSAQVSSVLLSSHAPISALLLVGGFGSSEYLYRRIQRWSGSKIPVIQPRNAWTAVVRGAIIRGLQGDIAAVQSRLSRRYYGVVHDSRYDAAKHDEKEKRWHELRCEWVVRNRIQWYIRRGDVTTESKKISFPFYRTIDAKDVVGGTHRLKTELWVCDEVEAPDKRDSTVRKLCVMTSEPVPVEKFRPQENGKGQRFWRVDYSLDMTVTGGVVVYEMRLDGKGGGEKVGSVEVKYE